MADRTAGPKPGPKMWPGPELIIPPAARELYADMARSAAVTGKALVALAQTGQIDGVPDPEDLGILANADWPNYLLSGKGLLVWATRVTEQLAQSSSLIVVQRRLHAP
jgi:hypothetical protein